MPTVETVCRNTRRRNQTWSIRARPTLPRPLSTWLTMTLPFTRARTHTHAHANRGVLAHSMRVDALTHHLHEEDTRWDQGWTARRGGPPAATPQWRPSLGRTSAEFLLDAERAQTRAEKNNMLHKARLAEAEEKEHSRKEAFLDKTLRFTDRGRFRCIGTPLLHHDERHQLASRRRYVVPIAMRLCGVETS